MWGVTLGAILGYAATVLLPFPPCLYFYPLLGKWSTTLTPGEPSIKWYGFMIYGVVGAILGGLVASRVRRRPPWALVWGIAAAVFLLLVWHERIWFGK